MERRLAAILAADVVGFGRLMEADEAGTLAALKARRKAILAPLLAKHHGRLVKLMGDGVLAEFASAVNAVACAVELQTSMASANGDVAPERAIVLRIGLNLGDVVVEGSDIYGDGVNIAARLEAMAEPGSIYVSRTVLDHVRNKVDLRFEDLGEQPVKNIREPIRVYRIAGPDAARGMAQALPLPAKPSIAVLPFTNMSGDQEQQYLSDGLTEDIITALCRFRQLFVIARNSSYAYKGHAKDIRQIGRELGVRYVLEGSVRKGGERLRITAQLIDATTGSPIWGERYDRGLADIFALQDEITETIVAAIEPELSGAERERARRKPPESLDAWACYHRGMWHVYRMNAEDADVAEAMLRRALAIEPQFAPALAGIAFIAFERVLFLDLTDAREEPLRRGLADARAAVALDDRDAFARYVLGRILTLLGQLDEGIAELRSAIDLNPSFAQAHHGLASSLIGAGRSAEAIEEADKALRLSPFDPHRWAFLTIRGAASLALGDYDSAVEWSRKATRLTTLFWPYAHLTCALGHLGRTAEAKAALDDLLRVKPDFSTDLIRRLLSFRRDPVRLAQYLEGLRKAGLAD